MALGKLRAVGSQDHGQVRIDRRLSAQGEQHVHLPRRVVQMIIAANHVRDLHVHVIDHDAEIIGRRAVGARNDQIIELGVLKDHAPVHDIIDHDLARRADS